MQLGYGWVAMTEERLRGPGHQADDADLPRAGRVWSRTPAASGSSGRLPVSNPAIVALFDRLPKPTYAEQVDGTRAFFRELNRLGLTGVGRPRRQQPVTARLCGAVRCVAAGREMSACAIR